MNRAMARYLKPQSIHNEAVRKIIMTMQESSGRSQALENRAFQDVFEDCPQDFEYRKGISGKVKS